MITIVSATNREESNTYKVAFLYSELLNQMNEDNQIMDLCNLPEDFIFSNFNNVSTPDFVNIIDTYIHMANSFIVISPEYHGSYPGILKVLIDCIGNEGFESKKVALVGVSSGRAGNLRGLDHLTALFHHLKAQVFSSKPKLSEINKLFSEDGVLDDSDTLKIVKNHIDGFLTF